MYYAETVINGVLMFRTTPDGKWQVHEGPRGQLYRLLSTMNKDDIHDILIKAGLLNG